MTFKKTVKVAFQPYEYAILDKAYEFASTNVTNKLMMMDDRYGH